MTPQHPFRRVIEKARKAVRKTLARRERRYKQHEDDPQ